ncbi:hypothetical protein R1sor_015123 [Riccia sorocarpa]|uniref:AB hydrolase-1 domain-containing protein n=1 Tax=Riccia sorocarpa TaxID=122646 RepID=A0ABD3HEC4_9MARC
MGGCSVWDISLVSYRMLRRRAFYRSRGLVSRIIRLENGTSIRCWVHLRDVSHRKRGGKKGNHSTVEERTTAADGAAHGKPLSERKALLFLHGFGEDGTTGWRRQVATFTKEYRVYIPDLIFFGSSSTTNQQRTEIFQADCMHDMLVKLGIKETHVVGTDYGGLVAFWLAHKYPEMVQKLVLCSTGVCMTPSTYEPLLKSQRMERIDEILLPTTTDCLKRLRSLLYSKPDNAPDFFLQQLLEVFYNVSMRPRRAQLLEKQVIGSQDCRPLPPLRQEVLIIWGREDKLLKLDLMYKLKQHLGPNNPQVAILDGCGHVPQVEKATHFNAIVTEFLAEGSSDAEMSPKFSVA